MDVEALHVALQQSFSPDANLRGPAEETIKNLKYVPGATQMLLKVTAEKQVQFEVRQAGAIQLKNICRECWVERKSFDGTPLPPLNHVTGTNGQSGPVVLSEADKEAVKTLLVDALLTEHEKSVRDILAETLHSIAVEDFPERWPTLFPTLMNVINSGNDPSQALHVHNALLALRKICKRYEYKAKELRGPLDDIVTQTFPVLLPLAQGLCDPNQHSLEAALMLKQILKIFWSSTQFYMPMNGPLSSAEAIQPWFDVFRAVLLKPLPEASTGLEPKGQPTDIHERNQWPWWKVKKWAIQIMTRIFSRYGVPNSAEEEIKAFSIHFSTNVAPQFLGPVLETLNLRPKGEFCTDRVVHLCLSYADLAVELSSTYKIMKGHLDFILYKVCFPTLCLNEDDIDQFENDPHEFIHKQSSILADFYDPRMSAITLIQDLVKHRGKDVVGPLLAFLNDCLARYSNATDDSQKNHIEKDGALLAIGSLSEYLIKKKKYSSQLEGLFLSSVFPDFNSPIAFLRCRACWMVQRFPSVNWSDDGTHLKTLIQLVLQRLSDPALPTQIEASKALRFLIELDGAETALVPVLPQILTEYFRIMNEIGNDEVVAALQVLIDRFGDSIEPHAVALVSQLSAAFKTYCAAGDDDDDSAMAAAQCLECVATVLKSTCEKPELYTNMYPELIPLLTLVLGNDGEYIEYLEYALDILTFITYFPESIDPQLWQIFPLVYNAFDQWAIDYLEMMVPPLQSYIGKGPEQFLACTTAEGIKFIDLVMKMVAKTLEEERVSNLETKKALTLLTTLLHCCKGLIDGYLPAINDLVVSLLARSTESDKLRIACFQVLGSALWYNPQAEVQELEKRGVTQQVLSQWTIDSKQMSSWNSRKLSIIGLSSILLMPTSTIPPSITSILPQLINEFVTMTFLLKQDIEQGPQFSGDYNPHDDPDNAPDEDFVDHDEDDGGFGEDEDVTNEDNQAYLEAIRNFAKEGNVAKMLTGEYWDQFDEDDDEEENYTSPLESVDQLLYAGDMLKGAIQREPEAYQQIQAAMAPEAWASCQKLIEAAEMQRLVISNMDQPSS